MMISVELIALIGAFVSAVWYHNISIDKLRKEFEEKLIAQKNECNECKLLQDRRLEKLMNRLESQGDMNIGNDKTLAVITQQMGAMHKSLNAISAKFDEMSKEMQEIKEEMIKLQIQKKEQS